MLMITGENLILEYMYGISKSTTENLTVVVVTKVPNQFQKLFHSLCEKS